MLQYHKVPRRTEDAEPITGFEREAKRVSSSTHDGMAIALHSKRGGSCEVWTIQAESRMLELPE